MSQTATGPRQCDCQHFNALTCQSERNHTTRFNALITYGACKCPCHRDAAGLPISEQAWTTRRATNPLDERPKSRSAYRNFHREAVRR